MNLETVRTVLWIVVGSLMVLGAVGVVLGILLQKSSALDEHPSSGRSALHVAAPAIAPASAVAPRPIDARTLAARKAAYRLGILVFAALAALTAIEFWIANTAGGSVVFLFLVALVKAGLIIQYYMHLRTVWGEEETHG